MGFAEKHVRAEELRTRIIQYFRDATRLEEESGVAIPTGWAALDAVLPGGGLAPGETAVLEGSAGGGALALAAAWAKSALVHGEPVAIVDTFGSALPHAFLDVPSGRDAPPLFLIAPPEPRHAWAAIDIVLRGGGFGLVVALEPGAPPSGGGGRVRRLVKERRSRLVISGHAPFTPSMHVTLVPRAVEWDSAPTGSTPSRRWMEVQCQRKGASTPSVEVSREDVVTDRMRPHPRAPDRRPSSTRESAARSHSGRRGRER
jgi:hypothetical protein